MDGFREEKDGVGAAGEDGQTEPLLVDHQGEPLEIPPEGNLWSLALGWRGVVAWRRARQAAGADLDHLMFFKPKDEEHL